jgi:hypothetical protein
MPHPKNRLKLTGDTHLPGRNMDLDLDLDLDMEEDVAMEAMEPRVYADGYVPSPEPLAMDAPSEQAASTVERVEAKVGKQAAKKPWMAIGGAIAFGFLVMRLLRR